MKKLTKFERVNIALMSKTRETSDYVRISKNIDGRHKGKYTLQNVITGSTYGRSYKTLDEIIEEFELNKESEV